MSRDESRRSKRCRADRDYEMGPATGIMVNDYDDERTLDEEEALEGSEDTHNELSHLQKESDMPLKELLVMYGYSDMSCQDPNKVDDDEEDEEDEEEEEEDEDDEDDDDPATYEPDLKQFYTDMVKGGENGASIKRPLAVRSGDAVRTGEADTLTPNIDAHASSTTGDSKVEEITGTTGSTSGDNQNPINTTDISSTVDNSISGGPGATAGGAIGSGGGGGGGSSRLLRSVSRPQSEEEEDDCDYSPDEEEWKKTIMVGSDYQAAIPEGLCKYDDALPYENEDKMLWDPSNITEEEVEEFLARAQLPVVKGTSLPSGRHVRDDEQALYLLLQCGYSLEEALRRRRMNVLPSTESVSLWSEEECHNFETGLRTYGKDFHLIQKNKVRTRSVGELVQFYYLWKKTERHDIFTYKARLEKKKYALHPGITDYMDRFLEEQEGVRDRSSSPNVHCLLYGDAKRQRTSANSTSNDEPSSKSALDGWEGSTNVINATTVTTTTTTSNTSTSTVDSSAVNSGPTDPLAIDHHHISSPPVSAAAAAGQLDYAKVTDSSGVETNQTSTAAASWSSVNTNTTTTPTPTTTTSPSSTPSLSLSVSVPTTSPQQQPQQQQQQQQRNHLHHHHLQQQSAGANSHNNSISSSNSEEAAAAATAVSVARSPENILPHLPP